MILENPRYHNHLNFIFSQCALVQIQKEIQSDDQTEVQVVANIEEKLLRAKP
jgi:hypothetical protein